MALLLFCYLCWGWIATTTVSLLPTAHANVYHIGDIEEAHNKSWWANNLGVTQFSKMHSTRIVWIGDSTSRNMMMFVCDLLGGGWDDTCMGCATQNLTIIGRAFGGGSAGWDMRTAASTVQEIEKSCGHLQPNTTTKTETASTTKKTSVVMFSTTAFHQMHLGKSLDKWGKNPLAGPGRSLAQDIQTASAALTKLGVCPILNTINWLCDERYSGNWAKTAKYVRQKCNKNSCTYFNSYCAKKPNAKLCGTYYVRLFVAVRVVIK